MREPIIEETTEIEDVNEYEFDVEQLKQVKHNWVKRGIIMSCEFAGHPNHRHFLIDKKGK
jgi:hypothetical protein